jgi:hypothetical protein
MKNIITRILDFISEREWLENLIIVIVSFGLIVGLMLFCNSDWAKNKELVKDSYVYTVEYTIHHPHGAEKVKKTGEVRCSYEPRCRKILRKRGVFIRVELTDVYEGKDDVTINHFEYRKKYKD